MSELTQGDKLIFKKGKYNFVPNEILMAKARDSLKDKWGITICACLVFFIFSIVVGCIPIIGGIAQLLIEGALCVGLCFFALNLIREKEVNISQLFDGFRVFGTALGAFLLTSIFILLWCLLLIIPGIIAAYSYAMVFYIIADDNNIGPLEAVTKSKNMMRGNKWKLFCLFWRFFGWFLLCMITFGIGFIWLYPYMLVAHTHFYESIKGSVSVVY